MSKPKSELYQYAYVDNAFLQLYGYIVYRKVWKEPTPFLHDAQLINIHKVASFSAEDNAKNYCLYRNYLIDIKGSDACPTTLDCWHNLELVPVWN